MRDYNEYSIDEIKQNDIVLDLGANVGGFSLRVCNKCRFVFAVEPICHEVLKKNLLRNNISNVEVVPWAIGNGEEITIKWAGLNYSIKSHNFENIINKIGRYPDFLKCDIEGGEYYIDPNHFTYIPRLEIEFHRNEKFHSYLKLIKKTHHIFLTHTDTHSLGVGVLHGFKKKDYPDK